MSLNKHFKVFQCLSALRELASRHNGKGGRICFSTGAKHEGKKDFPSRPHLSQSLPFSKLPSFREPIGSWVRVTGSHKVSSLLRFQDNTVILCSTSDWDQALGINDLQAGRVARDCCSAFRMTRIPLKKVPWEAPRIPASHELMTSWALTFVELMQGRCFGRSDHREGVHLATLCQPWCPLAPPGTACCPQARHTAVMPP